MHSTKAAAIINQLVFRPGWHFAATPETDRTVVIDTMVRTQDTSYPPHYAVPTTTGAGRIRIDVGALDDDGVVYAVLDQVIDPINKHEDREFLRRGDRPGYPAPFHPHKPDGERAYRAAQVQATMDPVDYTAELRRRLALEF
jgi:hypothetical protein